MPLRSLSTVIPGGWKYVQSLPDGSTRTFHSMNLVWDLAKLIADFRQGNNLPRATVKEALADIEEYSCARLHDDPQWCLKKKAPGVRPAFDRLFASARAAAGDGRRILVDWLGNGATPVPITVAQARANVCLGCPENRPGHRWLKLSADVVRAIAEQMQTKDAMKMRVAGEEKLHACGICLCPLPLKVHVPLPTILAHTDADTLAAFPNHCWITTERQQL